MYRMKKAKPTLNTHRDGRCILPIQRSAVQNITKRLGAFDIEIDVSHLGKIQHIFNKKGHTSISPDRKALSFGHKVLTFPALPLFFASFGTWVNMPFGATPSTHHVSARVRVGTRAPGKRGKISFYIATIKGFKSNRHHTPDLFEKAVLLAQISTHITWSAERSSLPTRKTPN